MIELSARVVRSGALEQVLDGSSDQALKRGAQEVLDRALQFDVE